MTRTLFAHDASKEGRVVTRLYGFESDDHRCRVAAEIYSVTHVDRGPQWLVLDFATGNHARRFADEALVALEYLDCIVTDVDVTERDEIARIASAAERSDGGPSHALAPAIAS